MWIMEFTEREDGYYHTYVAEFDTLEELIDDLVEKNKWPRFTIDAVYYGIKVSSMEVYKQAGLALA